MEILLLLFVLWFFSCMVTKTTVKGKKGKDE